MERIVMHIDVNNAFLSWSAVYLLSKGYKDIRNSYAAIGGDETTRHGIVLAKSPLAKSLGIETAETLYNARKKCPNLEVYPMNYPYYQQKSQELFTLISKYTPDIEKFSIDECFIEYTSVQNLYGDPVKFAYKLKDEIKSTLGFTVNIGIANNKLCAKMASDFTNLYRFFKNQTNIMIDHAKGIDNDPVVTISEERKGISHSFTAVKDIDNRMDLYDALNIISNDLGISIRKQNKYAYVIAVILKDSFFKNKTHQLKLINPTNNTDEIYKTSKMLLDQMWNGEPIRLVGIRLDKLVDNSYLQVSLFDNIDEDIKNNKIDTVMDELKDKYGTKIINKASLLSKTKKICI